MAHDTPDSLASLLVCEYQDPGHPGALQFDAKRQKFGPKEESMYPTPRGYEVSDYHHHPMIENAPGTHRPIDLIRLTFQPCQVEQFQHDQHSPDFRPIRSPSAIAYNCWRRDIVRQEGCEKLFWGICDAPASDTIVLFICWMDASAQAAGQHLVTRLPDDIAVLLSKPPEAFHLPSVASRNLQHFSPSFEIVFLSCPTASVDRQHFEHYYWSFACTLHPGAVYNGRGRYDHLASAGHICGGGWSSRPVNIDGQDADVFIGFINWQDKAARDQWYEDYSNMSYEKLGWRNDGLKKMASLGVESYCLPLSEENEEWISRYERWGFPDGEAKPRKPFPKTIITGGVL